MTLFMASLAAICVCLFVCLKSSDMPALDSPSPTSLIRPKENFSHFKIKKMNKFLVNFKMRIRIRGHMNDQREHINL